MPIQFIDKVVEISRTSHARARTSAMFEAYQERTVQDAEFHVDTETSSGTFQILLERTMLSQTAQVQVASGLQQMRRSNAKTKLTRKSRRTVADGTVPRVLETSRERLFHEGSNSMSLDQ